MASNYPASQDDNTTLPDPTTGDYTNNPSHIQLHANANDAIKELEAKVGYGADTPPGNNFILTSDSLGNSAWAEPPNSAIWGLVAGTLSDQTDLQAALDAKLSKSGGTMTGNLILNGAPSTSLQAATKDYVDSFGPTQIIRNEVPGGSVNGSNTAFTTASQFSTGSLRVYLNGQRLTPGSGVDYIEADQGFTMQYAPLSGDVLLVDYELSNSTLLIGTNSIITGETPTGAIDSSNTTFAAARAYIGGTLQVWLNGILQTLTTDYTETTPASGIFTMIPAPVTGDVLRISYQYNLNPSSNADTVDGIHANTVATANKLYPLGSDAKYSQAVLPTGSQIRLGVNEIDNAGATLTTSYVTFATVAASSLGGAVEIQWGAVVGNGASGAERNFDIQILCDGVATGITPSTINYDAIFISGATTYLSYGFIHDQTGLSAGAHTWTLRLKASINTAVVLGRAFLKVSEIVS